MHMQQLTIIHATMLNISISSILKLLIGTFTVITFSQTGLDKMLNYASNKKYFKEHFANSPLAKTIDFLFPAIVIQEITVAALSLAGILAIFWDNDTIILYAQFLASIVILQLYFGQRVAKDYVGASSMVPYFITTIIALTISLQQQ